MTRRWSIPLTTAALVLGSLMALGGTASAAPGAPRGEPGRPRRVGTRIPAGRPDGPALRGQRQRRHGPGPRRPDHGREHELVRLRGHRRQRRLQEHLGELEGADRHLLERSAQYASFWVGLDGFTSSSVEQTGTDSDCSGRTPDYYGWYEMFPADPVNFTNPVSPGRQLHRVGDVQRHAAPTRWC